MKKTIIRIFKILKKEEISLLSFFFFGSIFLILAETLSIGAIIPLIDIFFGGQKIDIIYFNFLSLNQKISIISTTMISVVIFKNIYFYYFNRKIIEFSNNVSLRLSCDILINYFNSTYLDQKRLTTAELIRNVSTEVSKVKTCIRQILNLFTELLIFVAIIGFLFWYNFYFTLIILILILLFFKFYFYLYKNKLTITSIKHIESSKNFLDSIIKISSAKEMIKIFKIEKIFLENFKKYLSQHNKNNLKLALFQIRPKILLEILSIVIIMIAFLFFGLLNYEKSEILTLIALFSFSIIRFIPSANRIFLASQDIRATAETLNILEARIEAIMENNNVMDNELLNDNFSSLELINVNFNYPNKNIQLLKDINIKILKSDIIGISGKNGSGKSTLLLIIAGLISPISGKIFINNRLITHKHNCFDWSGKLGFVSQDSTLINDTLIKNIILEKDYNKIDLENSIKFLNIEEWIDSLPQKELTVILEQGTNISGGQKQKINIARSLYRKPDLIIMDEPLNALDKQTMIKFIEFIKTNNKTLIIVSHNNLVFEYCNKVYEIIDGSLRKTY